MYAIPNRRTTTRVVPLPMPWETPLRTGNLRDPNGPQVTFAFESFIDELAAAAHADPVQFRIEMLARASEDGFPQGTLARRDAGRREGVWMGCPAVTRNHARQHCAVTRSLVAASHTPIAATPLPPRSPRSRSNAAPGVSGSGAWSAPTTAAS
jgi:hypothetical protein